MVAFMRSGFDLSAKIIRLQVSSNEYGSAHVDTSSVVADTIPCYLWQQTTHMTWGFDLSQLYDYMATLLLPPGITIEIGDVLEVHGPDGLIAAFRVLKVDPCGYSSHQQKVIVSGEVLNK